MKKIFVWVAILGVAMFACEPLDDVKPTTIFINQQGCSEEAFTDLMSGTNKVGSLKVKVKNDTVLVDYNLNADVYISEIKYHIATSINDIPQEGGIPQPQLFNYNQETTKILLSYITKKTDYKGNLYIAAYAKIGRQADPSKNAMLLNITRTHNISDPTYFKATLTDTTTKASEEYLAFCLQGDQKMDADTTHFVKRLSSYTNETPLLQGVIDESANIDLINWLVNQNTETWLRADGTTANGADLQMAIWKLIERTGTPTGTYIQDKFDDGLVTKIVGEAYQKGRGFKPGCGQKKIVILHKGKIAGKGVNNDFNTKAYANPFYQVAGIIQTVQCDEATENVWAKGSSLNNNNNLGMYFGFCID